MQVDQADSLVFAFICAPAHCASAGLDPVCTCIFCPGESRYRYHTPDVSNRGSPVPLPAGNAPTNATHYMADCLSHKGTLLSSLHLEDLQIHSGKLLFIQFTPSLCMKLIYPRYKTLQLSLLKFTMFHLAHFLSLLFSVSNTPTILISSRDLLPL